MFRLGNRTRIHQKGGSKWDTYLPNFTQEIQAKEVKDNHWTYWLQSPNAWFGLIIVAFIYYYFSNHYNFQQQP